MELTIIEAVGSAVLALLGWAIVIIVGLVKRKVAHDVVDRVGEFAIYVVQEVYQTYVEDLKKQGDFTKEAQVEALKIGVEKLRAYIGPKGLQVLVWLFGYSDKALDEFLAGQVEAAICAVKS